LGKYNLTNLPEGPSTDFEPLPEATYDISVVEVKKGLTRAGDEKIDIRWKVLSPNTVEGMNTKNRQFFDTLNLQPTVYWRLQQALEAVESDLATADNDDLELIMRAFRNKIVTADVIRHEFNNKTYNQIKRFEICTKQYGDSSPSEEPASRRGSAEDEDLPF